MRTFKHKLTGNIATETSTEKNYKVSEPKNFTVPKWIVEDSDDWEEIKQPLFITEDGHAIYDGKNVLWVDLDTTQDGADYLAYTISEIKNINKSRMPISIGKYFFLRANAERYIEENKPKYSKKDLISFGYYALDFLEFDRKIDFDYWIKYVKK